jgi:serine/threonine protein kinase
MCAIKIIQKSTVNEHLIIQLIREIKIQMFLDHPNIVQLFAFFSDENSIYLVMELCFSGNLYTHLRKESILPEYQIKPIIKQVCHALEYMHDNDILHRDLKP